MEQNELVLFRYIPEIVRDIPHLLRILVSHVGEKVGFGGVETRKRGVNSDV